MNRLKTILIKGQVIFPGEVIGFSADDREKLKVQLEAYDNDEELFLLRFKSDDDTERKDSAYTETNGVIAKVESVNEKDNGVTEVLVRAVRRGKLKSMDCIAPNEYEADVEEYVESEEGFDRMIRSLHLTMRGYSDVNERFRKNFLNDLLAVKSLPELLDGLRLALNLNYEKRKIINAAKTPVEESMLLMEIMSEAIDRKEISDRIKSEVDKDISKNQRDYILREHLKVIQNEMAKNSGYENITDEYEEKLESIKLPEEYKEKLKKDILRLNTSANNGPEGNVIRTYLDTVFEMPFGKESEDINDILRAKKILDEDHYGLEKVKDRILEYLSVRILNPDGNSPILCLVGPPGTGKTSIAKSVAKALGRKYVRISLGGVGDEAEIRGHRRTYVGAMPGRIVEAIKNAKVENPLLLLDEIDKTSRDYKGDVSSALLEVLDGEQNKTFRDRYLEIPLDLSKVLFIATANTLDTIPRPLLDRMDIIEISSYTENEKFHIAKKYLVPKEIEANGLKDVQISFSDKAIRKIIHNYTREAGVRNLSRRIGDICRKCARESLEGKESFKISEKSVFKYLGKEKVRYDEVEKEPKVGVVTGLAWTSVGGDTLSIEVNIMSGKGTLTLTGNMGDVMKESAGIAKSLVRSMAKEYAIEDDFFEKNDIHLHIPEGAVPKDGPSAGVTMTTAIISAITGKKVRADVAMTGEITLRGRVLPIGGLKEKLLAAKLAGVKTVCVPKENEADIAELSNEITDGLKIVYVSDIREVLDVALVK